MIRKEVCLLEIFRDMISYTGIAEPEDYPHDPIAYKQFAITRQLCVPTPKPDIEGIIKIISEAMIKNVRLLRTPYDLKFIVDGIITQTIMYTAAVPDQSVHTFHGEIPFSEIIVLNLECAEDFDLHSVDAKIIIEDVHAFYKNERCIEETKVLCIILEEHHCKHHDPCHHKHKIHNHL